jgi:hypothetical protein
MRRRGNPLETLPDVPFVTAYSYLFNWTLGIAPDIQSPHPSLGISPDDRLKGSL